MLVAAHLSAVPGCRVGQLGLDGGDDLLGVAGLPARLTGPAYSTWSPPT